MIDLGVCTDREYVEPVGSAADGGDGIAVISLVAGKEGAGINKPVGSNYEDVGYVGRSADSGGFADAVAMGRSVSVKAPTVTRATRARRREIIAEIVVMMGGYIC